MAMLRSFGSTSFMTLPSTRSSPDEMSSSPTIMLSNVDFPHPDGPTRMKNSPSLIVKSASSTASKPSPKRLLTLSSTISAICACPLSALHRAGREPGHDAPLEDQDHHDDRDGHHHRRGGDLPRRIRELRRPVEERQRGRHG